MKQPPARQVLQRIREVVARDTGKPLSEAGTAEIEGVEFTSVPPETNTKIQLFVQLPIFTDLT